LRERDRARGGVALGLPREGDLGRRDSRALERLLTGTSL
jgi:hypothetical protein